MLGRPLDTLPVELLAVDLQYFLMIVKSKKYFISEISFYVSQNYKDIFKAEK